MGEAGDRKAFRKEALKSLRELRKPRIEAATARMKEQKKAIEAIKAALRQGEQTVPELAEATGIGTETVLWYIAALKKYGQILEGEADGSYFRYALAAPSTEKGAEEA